MCSACDRCLLEWVVANSTGSEVRGRRGMVIGGNEDAQKSPITLPYFSPIVSLGEGNSRKTASCRIAFN